MTHVSGNEEKLLENIIKTKEIEITNILGTSGINQSRRVYIL